MMRVTGKETDMPSAAEYRELAKELDVIGKKLDDPTYSKDIIASGADAIIVAHAAAALRAAAGQADQ